MSAALGVLGVGAAVDAQAAPGPFPQWCPGEFWDPGWGDNWDGWHCHDNFRPGWYHDDRGGWHDDRDHGPDHDRGWDHR